MARATTSTSTQEAAAPSDKPAGDMLMYFNDAVGQHPRHHQPADPDEAKRVSDADADARATVDNSDIKPQPAAMSTPKEIVKKADEVNEEIAKRSDTP